MGISRSFRELGQKLTVAANVTTPQELDRMLSRTALAVDQVAVLETPVDTGRARVNWRVSVGQESEEEPREPIQSGPEGSAARKTANAQKAINSGRNVINRSQLAFSPIFISNNVAYIERLEAGSSAQAPQGMLRAAVQAGARVARKERLRVLTQ